MSYRPRRKDARRERFLDLHAFLARKAEEMHEAEELNRRTLAVGAELNHRQLAPINHALRQRSGRYAVESHLVSRGVSYETARSDLLKLVRQGFLRQRKVGKAHVFVPVADMRA